MAIFERAKSGRSADEAFALVADETRLEILRTLAAADDPLAFSTLFDRSEYDTRSNFSYHLEKLEGHFVSRTDEGYALRQTGRRIVEAVIGGTVTDDPVLERAETDRECPFCSAPYEVRYEQERLEMFCTECQGAFRQAETGAEDHAGYGSLGAISIPPAAVDGRTPTELTDAAAIWDNLDVLAAGAGVCSRCSGRIEHTVRVCADHDPNSELCDECDRRYAALFEVRCTACHYDAAGIAIVSLLADTELLSFLTDHGINPLAPETRERAPGMLANYDEEVRSIDPLRVAITFTVDDDALTLTVDEDATVVDATRS